jgi:predicted transcriptional regulator
MVSLYLLVLAAKFNYYYSKSIFVYTKLKSKVFEILDYFEEYVENNNVGTIDEFLQLGIDKLRHAKFIEEKKNKLLKKGNGCEHE